MHPIVDGLAKDYYVYEIDIDNQRDVAEAFKVSSVPTSIIMEGGKEITRFTGVVSKSKLTAKLKTRNEQEPGEPDYNFR